MPHLSDEIYDSVEADYVEDFIRDETDDLFDSYAMIVDVDLED